MVNSGTDFGGNFEEDYMRKEYPKLEDLEYKPDEKQQFKDENMYKYHDNT